MITVKRYSAQALAVVMIVLVISIVLGMAMLSRVLKDNIRSVDEKSSAEALETADSLFDAVKGTSIDDIKSVCASTEYGAADLSNGGVCRAQGMSSVRQFLTDLGVEGDATSGLDNCQSENSTIEVKTAVAGPDDELEIESDSVRSFVLRGQVPNPNTCELRLTLESRGNTVAGVMISRIYGKDYVNGVATEYKEYDYADITPYCIFSTGADCASSSLFLNNWTAVSSGSQISIPLTASGTYLLDEIRVRSVNSSVALKASLSNPGCIKDWEMIKMEVGANCTGSYRAKEVQIPQQEWALPVFDYVLFNGNGILKTE